MVEREPAFKMVAAPTQRAKDIASNICLAGRSALLQAAPMVQTQGDSAPSTVHEGSALLQDAPPTSKNVASVSSTALMAGARQLVAPRKRKNNIEYVHAHHPMDLNIRLSALYVGYDGISTQ